MKTSSLQLWRHVVQVLAEAEASREEAVPLARILMEDALGLSRTQLLADTDVAEADAVQLLALAERVAGGEPVQYAVGSALFRNHRYAVDARVLIPRPETELLVDLALADLGQKDAAPTELHFSARPSEPPAIRVLDVGTGSGCIAIELSLALGQRAEVWGWDISHGALQVAHANAARLGASVRWAEVDMHHPEAFLAAHPAWQHALDAIVSNPPYISPEERAEMSPIVLNHEPAGALFVEADAPLRPYESLLRLARRLLKRPDAEGHGGGSLLVETSHLRAAAVRALCEKGGMAAHTVPDQFGAERFVVARMRRE